jgi:hypothetical protein
MPMLFKLAIAGAAATSSIALYDAVHHGLTGRYSVFSSDSDLPGVELAGSLVHGFTYAALATVLLVQSRITSNSQAYRWMCRLLSADFVVLAAVFLIGEPIAAATGISIDATPAGPIAGGITFLLMFLLSFALGFTILRRPERRTSAVILLAIGPVLLLTVTAAALGSEFAHPAYAETLVHFGVALLALPASAAHLHYPRTATEAALASPRSQGQLTAAGRSTATVHATAGIDP